MAESPDKSKPEPGPLTAAALVRVAQRFATLSRDASRKVCTDILTDELIDFGADMEAKIARLQRELADAKADVQRLHMDKMELMQKYVFSPASATQRSQHVGWLHPDGRIVTLLSKEEK